MKFCRWCGRTKVLDDFYTHPEMSDGHLNKCKQCVKDYARHRRLVSDRPREIDNRRYREGKKDNRRFEREFPERVAPAKRASCAVQRAIKKGLLNRPSVCEWCKQDAFCEAAHEDYSKPLDVRWLCRRCHRRWDADVPKTLGVAS